MEDRLVLSGTPELLANINRTFQIESDFVESQGLYYFAASDEDHGLELWRSDGTAAGTYAIDVIAGPDSSNPAELTDVNGELFFVSDFPDFFGTSRALMKTDGTRSI